MRMKIEGVPGYNGDYDLDLNDPFTMREYHTIKTIAGVRGGELQDAIAAGDTDMMVAFAVIAIQRTGKQINPEVLWESKSGSILVVPELEEEDPTSPTSTGGEHVDGTNETQPPSGETSNGTSGSSPENDQSPTGHPGSATTSSSDPETSPV